MYGCRKVFTEDDVDDR
jgi:hypothetical protein